MISPWTTIVGRRGSPVALDVQTDNAIKVPAPIKVNATAPGRPIKTRNSDSTASTTHSGNIVRFITFLPLAPSSEISVQRFNGLCDAWDFILGSARAAVRFPIVLVSLV